MYVFKNMLRKFKTDPANISKFVTKLTLNPFFSKLCFIVGKLNSSEATTYLFLNFINK